MTVVSFGRLVTSASRRIQYVRITCLVSGWAAPDTELTVTASIFPCVLRRAFQLPFDRQHRHWAQQNSNTFSNAWIWTTFMLNSSEQNWQGNWKANSDQKKWINLKRSYVSDSIRMKHQSILLIRWQRKFIRRAFIFCGAVQLNRHIVFEDLFAIIYPIVRLIFNAIYVHFWMVCVT